MSIINQFLALGLQTKLLIAGVALIIIGSILQAIGDATSGERTVEEKEVRPVHGVAKKSWVRSRNAVYVGTSSVHKNVS